MSMIATVPAGKLRTRMAAELTTLRAPQFVHRYRHQFADVERFCFFVGVDRSGTSLVEQLLNAHRNMVIAHEYHALNFIRRHPDRDKLFALLLEHDRRFCATRLTGRAERFAVPGQWQGRTERLRVLGDKRSSATTALLRRRPDLVDAVRTVVGVPIRVVCVTRNPFDTIATMTARSEEHDLDLSVGRYRDLVDTVHRLELDLAAGELLHVRLEDLIADTPGQLRRLCEFLGVDAPDDYLADCSSIVFDSPRRSRDGTEWPDGARGDIERLIDQYPFLAGYSL